jgi:LysM repeat protein
MRTRTWAIFIIANIIVTTLVVLIILYIWERRQGSVPPSATSSPETPAAADTPSVPTGPPTSSPSPTQPTTQYTVQAGDTLGGIAQAYDISIEDLMALNGIDDPNLLQIGQILVIPVSRPILTLSSPEAATPEATPDTLPHAPLPTLTVSGPPLVEIAQVVGAGELANEVAVVRNLGGAVNLENWILSDAEGNAFAFPMITLFADGQMRIHSIPGRSTPSDLYWGRDSTAWDNGELITLSDSAGDVVDTYIVP